MSPTPDTPYKVPLFFTRKRLQLRRNDAASDNLHDVKEFQHETKAWMVKDINANGRERYEAIPDEIKSLLLQAEMMHSELFNFISGINGPHYRVIVDDEGVTGLASEKVEKIAEFLEWLQKNDLKSPEAQKKLRGYFQLLTAQMMIEDPDPNPYNVMVTSSGLVKIDEGWACYQLLLSIMQRPTPFEHDVKTVDDVKTVGSNALSQSLGDFPIGELLKQFLPKFLHALGYWFIQKQLIFEACKPFFAMNFKELHAFIKSQPDDDSTILESLVIPTLVYHFISNKCSALFSKKELTAIQAHCHKLIEKGVQELIELVHQSLTTWVEKALVKVGLVALPSAKGLESKAFAKALFQFADTIIGATESQVCDARQQVAKKYDLTLQFQTMHQMELCIRMIPWMTSISSSLLMTFAEQLSTDYYLTATLYILTDKALIERAAKLARMDEDATDLFVKYHQERQQQYRKQLQTDPHYRCYFSNNNHEIKGILKKRVDTFNANNPFYKSLNLTRRFNESFDQWKLKLGIQKQFAKVVKRVVLA